MRGVSLLLMVLVATGTWAQRVQEVPNPRERGGWVTDMVGILTPDQRQHLNEAINSLERDTGAEMAIVILRRTVDAEPKEFATELFNRWGVGKKDINNGVLILVALEQRRVEVETGYGIEAIIPDSEVGLLLQDFMVPAFRRGDYAGGLMALVRELSQRIRDRLAEPAAAPTAQAPPIGAILGVLLTAGGVGLAGWLLLRERAPRCPTCRQPMRLLTEQQDDAYLNPLQLLEERLKSVDYRVWRCDRCQTLEIRPRVLWWSGYEKCPKCGGRTVQTRSYVVREPTYTRSGLEMIHKVCKNPRCDYEDEQQRVLPRRERAPSVIVTGGGGSSRSGGWFGGSASGGGGGWGGWSGGGSFGGGSSGGGGAGASWVISLPDNSWSGSTASSGWTDNTTSSSATESSFSDSDSMESGNESDSGGSFGGGESGGGGAGASW